mgnify:CR=1 FL=1
MVYRPSEGFHVDRSEAFRYPVEGPGWFRVAWFVDADQVRTYARGLAASDLESSRDLQHVLTNVVEDWRTATIRLSKSVIVSAEGTGDV